MAELYKREGSPYWHAIIRDPRRPRGIQRRSTGCRNKSEARTVAEAFERSLQEEIAATISAAENSCGLRWLDAVELLMSHGDLKPSSLSGYANISTVVFNILGDFDLGQLTEEDIRNFCHIRRQQTVKPHKAKDTGRRVMDQTIRNNLSMMSSVYRLVMDLQLPNAPKSNPFRTFDRSFLRPSRKTDRHLRPNQFKQILEALKSTVQKTMLIVLVGTGMRSSELLDLRWGEIDFKEKVIEFGNIDPDRTKSSRSRRIPLHPVIAATLLAHKKTVRYTRDGLVFPNPKTGKRRYDLKQLIVSVRSKTGIKGYWNHGLRHTFASWARQQGMDADAIRRALGHSTTSTTDRYAHHVSDSMVDQFRRMTLPFDAQKSTQTPGFVETSSGSELDSPEKTGD